MFTLHCVFRPLLRRFPPQGCGRHGEPLQADLGLEIATESLSSCPFHRQAYHRRIAESLATCGLERKVRRRVWLQAQPPPRSGSMPSNPARSHQAPLGAPRGRVSHLDVEAIKTAGHECARTESSGALAPMARCEATSAMMNVGLRSSGGFEIDCLERARIGKRLRVCPHKMSPDM